MINYFNQVLDQYDEKQVNEKIASLPESPKNDSLYALILKKDNNIAKKFPIDTSMNTALSYLSYEKNASKLTPEMRKIAGSNLANALDLFGIEHNIPQYEVTTNVYEIKKSDEQPLNKIASIEKKYFAIESDKGNKLPIDTISDLNDSIKIFFKEAYKLPHSIKKEAAFKFVKRASELNLTSVPSAIYQYCSKTPVEVKQMKASILDRTMNYPLEGKKVAYEALESIKTAEDVETAIEIINGLDKMFNIIPGKFEDLSKAFYTTKKTASAQFDEKLKIALDNNTLNDYLDTDIISSLKTGELNYDNLNPRTKQVIETILNHD